MLSSKVNKSGYEEQNENEDEESKAKTSFRKSYGTGLNKKNNVSISSNIRDKPPTSMINNKDLGYYLCGVAKFFKTKEEGYFANLFREHWKHTFISLQFCKNLKPPPKRELIIRKTNLTRKDRDKGKKTLVLD